MRALTARDFLSLTERFARKDLWHELLRGLGAPIVMVGGREDLNLGRRFYRGLDNLRLVQPVDGLALARLINGASVFIGCQSLGAALAEGLKVPRLVDGVFGNALPFPGPEAPGFFLSKRTQPLAVSDPGQADHESLAMGRDFLTAALSGGRFTSGRGD